MLTCSPDASSTSRSRASGRFRHVHRELLQAVRLAGHGREDDRDPVPLGQTPHDAVGHGRYPLRAGHRRAAELVYVAHGKTQAERSSTQCATDASASPSASGRVPPPARAMSGRSAAPRAHLLADEADDLAGLEAVGQVLRDAGDEVHAPVVHLAEHDHRPPELVLQAVERREQRLRVAGHLRAEHPHAVDFHGTVRETRPLGLGELRPGRLELLREGPCLAGERLHLVREFTAPRAHHLGDVGDEPLALLHPRQRAASRHRLDAADSGRDARLGDDVHEADVPRAAHVGAAAELDGVAVAEGEDAHFFAVLLAEQGDRAPFHRLGERHDLGGGGAVLANARVDLALDAPQLLRAHGRRMREVEAQAVGRHQGALLLDVRPEHAAQRLVQQVGRGVVEDDVAAPRAVDARGDFLPHLEGAFREPAPVQVLAAAARGVLHLEADAVGADLSRVAHLAARFRVERRPVQRNEAGFPGPRAASFPRGRPPPYERAPRRSPGWRGTRSPRTGRSTPRAPAVLRSRRTGSLRASGRAGSP